MKQTSFIVLIALTLPLVACDSVRGEGPTPVASSAPGLVIPVTPNPTPSVVPEEPSRLILNKYRFDQIEEAPSAGATEADRIARESIAPEARTICRALWSELNRLSPTGALNESENPYRLLQSQLKNWVIPTQLKGDSVEVLPSDFKVFDLKYSERWAGGQWFNDQSLRCYFPEKWQGWVQRVEISVPQALNRYSACYSRDPLDSGLCHDGYDTFGGLVLRRTEHSWRFDRFDHQFHLAWQLLIPQFSDQEAKSVAKAIKFPSSKKIALRSILSAISPETTHPVKAIQFAAKPDFSDVTEWLLVSAPKANLAEGPRRFWRVLGNDEAGPSSGQTIAKSDIESALASTEVFPLSFGTLWDSGQRRTVRARYDLPINQLIDFELYRLSVSTLSNGQPLWIRFIWQTDDQRWFETQTGIRADGTLLPIQTKAINHPFQQGLPKNMGVRS